MGKLTAGQGVHGLQPGGVRGLCELLPGPRHQGCLHGGHKVQQGQELRPRRRRANRQPELVVRDHHHLLHHLEHWHRVVRLKFDHGKLEICCWKCNIIEPTE